jgi:hypothetical protein
MRVGVDDPDVAGNGPGRYCSPRHRMPDTDRRVLLAPSPSTLRNWGFEWCVPDSGTGATGPADRISDLPELITPQIGQM